MFSLYILSGVFLGWGLGANDSANVFGIAVHTKVVKYSTAVILTAIFVILGALIDGGNGIEHLSTYAYDGGVTTAKSAFFVMLSAGITVLVMTLMKLPVSTSQGVIGAIIGSGIIKGVANFSAGIKFFSAWVLTPIGGMIIAYLLYLLVQVLVEEKLNGFKFYQKFIKIGYIIAGVFGAYALGANNVANVTAIFAGQLNLLSSTEAVIIGGVAIALGVVTFSKPVMSTVGTKLVPLSQVAGLVVVVAAALTVYIYAKIGIPVSTSQAVVGAIIGIGIRSGGKTINKKTLFSIFFGWVGTPTVAGIISLTFSLMIG